MVPQSCNGANAPIAGSETHEQRPILRTMRRLVGRVLRIGAAEGDTEDERLRKVLLLAVTVMVVPAAGVWGAIYWAFGETRLPRSSPGPTSSSSPSASPVFGLTRRYAWFAITQFTTFLVLPFVLMWSLGGFVSGSACALWAWLSPLGARTVGHRRAALLLFIAFAAGFALSAALQPRLHSQDGQLPSRRHRALRPQRRRRGGHHTGPDRRLLGRSRGHAGLDARYRAPLLLPDVADAILADPDRQALGGELAEVTILFADLGGYTTLRRAIARPTRSSSC